MKSKVFTKLFLLTLLAQITPASGNEKKTFPCGGTATYSVSLPAGIATDGGNCSGSLTIDDSVKIIGNDAFRWANLTSVVIPNSVTSIGDYAFEGLQVTSVIIGSSVTSIGSSAFERTNLVSVSIPNSVTSIGPRAFQNNWLNTVDIGNSVISIGGCAFCGTRLTSISIPNSVKTIGDSAFEGILSLTSLTIGDSVTRIGHSAFRNTRLSSVIIPNSVTSIGWNAFANIGLMSLTIGNSVADIGNGAFYSNKLTSVIIPNSVAEIGDFAFAANSSLKSISFPDNLQYLGEVVVWTASGIKIEYCGNLTGFGMTPVCPPERQAIIDAAKADLVLKAKQESEAKVAALKKTTITCTKGKLTKKVIAVKPKCPSGYKKK